MSHVKSLQLKLQEDHRRRRLEKARSAPKPVHVTAKDVRRACRSAIVRERGCVGRSVQHYLFAAVLSLVGSESLPGVHGFRPVPPSSFSFKRSREAMEADEEKEEREERETEKKEKDHVSSPPLKKARKDTGQRESRTEGSKSNEKQQPPHTRGTPVKNSPASFVSGGLMDPVPVPAPKPGRERELKEEKEKEKENKEEMDLLESFQPPPPGPRGVLRVRFALDQTTMRETASFPSSSSSPPTAPSFYLPSPSVRMAQHPLGHGNMPPPSQETSSSPKRHCSASLAPTSASPSAAVGFMGMGPLEQKRIRNLCKHSDVCPTSPPPAVLEESLSQDVPWVDRHSLLYRLSKKDKKEQTSKQEPVTASPPSTKWARLWREYCARESQLTQRVQAEVDIHVRQSFLPVTNPKRDDIQEETKPKQRTEKAVMQTKQETKQGKQDAMQSTQERERGKEESIRTEQKTKQAAAKSPHSFERLADPKPFSYDPTKWNAKTLLGNDTNAEDAKKRKRVPGSSDSSLVSSKVMWMTGLPCIVSV